MLNSDIRMVGVQKDIRFNVIILISMFVEFNPVLDESDMSMYACIRTLAADAI